MSERITGISLQDITAARRQVGEQQIVNGSKTPTGYYDRWGQPDPREAAKIYADTHRLHVRRMVVGELARQATHITPDATAPVFHPDILSDKFDHQIDLGEIIPVVVPFRRTDSGLEVPLYTIDAARPLQGTPLGELVEEADPEHNPVGRVIDIVEGEGPRVVEKLGQDPETTSIQVVSAHSMQDIFRADALAVRKTVTSTPSRFRDEMVTVKGQEVGHHPKNENSVPTRLVISRRMPVAV